MLPDGLGSIRAFGVPLNARELERTNQGKQVIYGSAPEGPPGAKELYVRSHRDYGPGEQHQYGYDFKVSA